jgi:colanic acid biosynthesis glycosyl transferase WcaI
MRVVVHDYVGHPFQVELSRELARRGHRVLHVYCSSFTTPRGELELQPTDSSNLSITGIELASTISRERLISRRRLEVEHGKRVAACLDAFRPDVVLSANAPLESQKRIVGFCQREGVRFVYWVQDLIGEAMERLLRPRLGKAVAPVVWYYRSLERRLLHEADAVVVIAEDFLPFVPRDAAVIENWAPLDGLELRPKDNGWSRTYGLAETTNIVYAGTLGMKHDPGLLVRFSEECSRIASARVVVATEGSAADWLREQALALDLRSLVVLPFQPFSALSDMLAAADVLVAMLEPDAGVFSVPSKVLTHLCAGKPQLLVVPPENLAARIVRRAGAGVVVDPGDRDAATAALIRLLMSPEERQDMGRRARAYAERMFAIGPIADRFEAVLRVDE